MLNLQNAQAATPRAFVKFLRTTIVSGSTGGGGVERQIALISKPQRLVRCSCASTAASSHNSQVDLSHHSSSKLGPTQILPLRCLSTYPIVLYCKHRQLQVFAPHTRPCTLVQRPSLLSLNLLNTRTAKHYQQKITRNEIYLIHHKTITSLSDLHPISIGASIRCARDVALSTMIGMMRGIIVRLESTTTARRQTGLRMPETSQTLAMNNTHQRQESFQTLPVSVVLQELEISLRLAMISALTTTINHTTTTHTRPHTTDHRRLTLRMSPHVLGRDPMPQ
jgi:hypothetical protein